MLQQIERARGSTNLFFKSNEYLVFACCWRHKGNSQKDSALLVVKGRDDEQRIVEQNEQRLNIFVHDSERDIAHRFFVPCLLSTWE